MSVVVDLCHFCHRPQAEHLALDDADPRTGLLWEADFSSIVPPDLYCRPTCGCCDENGRHRHDEACAHPCCPEAVAV